MNQKPVWLILAVSGSAVGLKLLDVSAALNQLAQADPKKTPPGGKQKLAPFLTIMSTCTQVLLDSWHACFYNSWRMYGNAQTAWIQRWRFWGDIDVNWSLLQRAGKTPLLQSITSLPFGTTLLITVKHGTEDERGWAETQTQSQGVHETPSDTATYCESRLLAIQRIVKL